MAPHTFDQIRTDGQTSQNSTDDPDPLEILAAIARVLKDSRRTLLLSALVGGLLVGAIGFFMKPVFTATSSFIPPSNTGGGSMAAVMSQLSSMGGAGGLLAGSKTSGDLYVGILKSQTISHALIQRFNLMKVYKVTKESVAARMLAAHTEFTSGVKDGIVSVSVTDPDPARARDLANGYLEALHAASGSMALTENSQRRQFFEQRLAIEKDALANAEVALKQTQEQSGFIAPTGQTSIELGAIAQLRAQIAAGEVKLASLRTEESDQNPDIIRQQQELASLRGQVNQMENGKGSHAGGLSTAAVPALELEYIRRARDVKYHETLFDILAKQYESARIDEAHEATLQVLDRAVIPDTKSGPHRLQYVLAGSVLGLLLSSAWILLRAFRKSRQDLNASIAL